uniref:RNase H type-1 domain-containing protein n=1 Tax=Nicotiana tabacum TaxID=4097 RepID=A0A1S3Y3T8_TOBAC
HVAEILRKYEQSSSQVVNLDKSAICFSRNVMEGEKVEIFSLLGQQQRNEMGMYLELPAIVGRSKKKMLEFIKDRVKTKIKGWKGKFLSTAGKEVMLKSGQTEDKRKMQIEKWEILCDSKSRGGLGFRDLKAFNMALLAKQARRSWIWRSILWGRDLLVTGLRWRISDGKNINVWPNPWIPRKNGFTPKSIQMQNNLDLKVVDLIDEDTHTWKLHKISTTFEPEDVDAILSIPISIIGLNDRLLWHHSKSRNYEVKSCYYLAKGLAGKTISSSEAQLVWKQSPINCPDIDSIPDFSVWWYNLFLNAKHFPESTELLDLSVNLMWQIWKDTGLRCDDRHTSIGVATLNSLGKPLYAHRSSIQYVGKTMTAEAIGIRKALECAITLGWKSVKILSDAKNVVDMIQKQMTPKVPKDPNGVKAHKEVKAPKAPKQPIIPPGPYVPVAPPT